MVKLNCCSVHQDVAGAVVDPAIAVGVSQDADAKALHGLRVSAGRAQASHQRLERMDDLAGDRCQRIVRTAFGSWARGTSGGKKAWL